MSDVVIGTIERQGQRVLGADQRRARRVQRAPPGGTLARSPVRPRRTSVGARRLEALGSGAGGGHRALVAIRRLGAGVGAAEDLGIQSAERAMAGASSPAPGRAGSLAAAPRGLSPRRVVQPVLRPMTK